MARNTAETVGMYAVLLRARSHVSPISWQSLLNILLALLSSCSAVPFLLPPFSCNNFIEHMKGHFGPRNKFVTNWSNCVQCKSAKCTWRRRFLRSIAQTYLVDFKKPQKHSPKVPPLGVNFTFRGYVYLAIYVPAIISSR